MADKSGIGWTDATLNVITGCTRVSNGCTNCYAEKLSWRLQDNPKTKYYQGTVRKTSKGQVLWTGQINLVPEKLTQPLRWKRPRMIFTNSMSDLFHDGVPDDFLDALFGIMWITPYHIYQNLTKRPKRMKEYISNRLSNPTRWKIRILDAWEKYNVEHHKKDIELELKIAISNEAYLHNDLTISLNLPQHIGIGISCEDQATADKRIPILTSTPAQFRFLSIEPLLENINFPIYHPCIHHILVGGESGINARDCYLDWIRNIVNQSRYFSIPVFVKQLGTKSMMKSTLIETMIQFNTKDKKGANIDEFPPDLQIREFPTWMLNKN